MKQRALPIELQHLSRQQKRRIHSVAEDVYSAMWALANGRRRGVNGGHTLIEWVLCDEDQRYPDFVTQREAEVAACVIQWLGTNCGMSFLEQCRVEIARRRRNADEFFREHRKRLRKKSREADRQIVLEK